MKSDNVKSISRLMDDQKKRIGEILRTSGLPMGMSLILYGRHNRELRVHEFSMKFDVSIHSTRTMMSRLRNLGIFVKSNLSARDVVYVLTDQGTIVANCLETLLEIQNGGGV